MPSQKRKRPHDDAPSVPSKPPTDALPRRTTRQAAAEDTKHLRSGRVRANNAEQHLALISTSPPSHKNRKDAPKPVPTATTPAVPMPSAAPKRPASSAKGQHANPVETLVVAVRPSTFQEKEKENVRPQPARVRETAIPPPKVPLPQARSPVMLKAQLPSQSPQTTPRVQTRIPPPRLPPPVRAQAPATTLADPAMVSAVTPVRRASIAHNKKPPPTPRSDRNIDKVVLGNVSFRAWYPSYYGKEVLGDVSGNGGAKEFNGGAAKIGGGKKDKEAMLDLLYICPWCFKYSKELVPWRQHVRACERTSELPGTKIYTHPKAKRAVKSPVTAASIVEPEAGKGKGKKKADVSSTAAEGLAGSHNGEWSVWELDGEKDGTRSYSVRISLFAKLFLDNKSVFFDVTGFNYFLLVYTPPPFPSSSSARSPPAASLQPAVSRPQIVGFFSKEKMSWDNNNLACILVFPPWQRKGLGSLLMGVSYEISRREGILGGPEKPISELGKKGYKRFWAGEIARWMLGLEVSTAKGKVGQEHLIDVEECSKATWISPEDCLVVLREMGVIEDAGVGAPKGANVGLAAEGEEAKEVKEVPRVRLDKEAVRRWITVNRIGLDKTCDPEGFIEGYALKKGEHEEVVEEDEDGDEAEAEEV